MSIDLKRYAKFGVALLGAAAVTANYALPLLPARYQTPVTIALVFLAAAGVYQAPYVPSRAKAAKAKGVPSTPSQP